MKVSLPRTDARLFAGMFARVAIPAGERRRLLVPEAAVERVGQLEYVTIVAGEGDTERRLVTTGEAARNGTVEVLSGVQAGDRVVLPDAAQGEGADGTHEAAAAIRRFRDELGMALTNALAEGPEPAIDACRVEAPRVTRSVAPAGITLGRTSHRLRNPDNAPAEWMVPLLEEFERSEPMPGASRTVDLGPRGTGYVEPIYVQPLCATCHGENVEPALLARIREHYPRDEAIGFRIGEFRGLFWAVVEGTSAP